MASNIADYPQGEYDINGSYQLLMRNAKDNTIPPRELRPFNAYSHYTVLSAL
jgi:hypothetical protein